MRETALSKRPDFVDSDVREEKDDRSAAERQAEIDNARKTVASFSEDADELRMFLSMLGIDRDINDTTPLSAAGTEESSTYRIVDGERARAHIKHLRDHDVPMLEIAERAEVSLTTLYGVLDRKTARDETVDKICAVLLDDCARETADCAKCGMEFIPREESKSCRPCRRGDVLADAARARLRELHAYTGSWVRVAAMVGLTEQTLRTVRGSKCTHIRPATEARILAVAVPESAERKVNQ